MRKIKILWTDDEIDLLKPHIQFLKEKGYEISTATNGDDTIELVKNNFYDLIFLDENMPGLSGLDTLSRIKQVKPMIPVVMITKSEEEDFMDAAIGSQIADFLIKPVKPNQILLSIKKNIDHKRLISQETTSAYQSEFQKLSISISNALSYNDWKEIYRQLVFWDLQLEHSEDSGMKEVLQMQKIEAENEFSKFIMKNYVGWFKNPEVEIPLFSPSIFQKKVLPLLQKNEQVIFILVDNLRYDQWKTIQSIIGSYYYVDEDELYLSILPTATQYSRNAMFAGLMPSEIEGLYPKLWIHDEEDGHKNIHEEDLLKLQLQRLGWKEDFHFEKIFNNRAGKKLVESLPNILNHRLLVLVYNFVDMLSHANTEMQMIRELASSDSAYRSLTQSWFIHSYLNELLRILADKNVKIVLTTDHGTTRVNNPVKVVGDKRTSTNLRYKLGKNLSYKSKELFEISNPQDIFLPKSNLSSRYIFASKSDFMVYPNNYNHYVNYFNNTYQHGGISMEEMLIPIITLRPR